MKKILFLLVAMIILSAALQAEMKIAYIDTDRIMMASADTQQAQTILMGARQEWEKEISDLDAQIKQLENDFESKKMILTKSGKEEAEAKIDEMKAEREQKVQEYFGENGKFYQKQNELLEPILTKLKNVIEKISVEDNYTVVLDAAAGSILYAKPSLDITDKVIGELEKTIEE